MNNTQTIRTTSFSLWTMGHRRYYSPMLRTAGRPPATESMVTPRVRPSLVLRSIREKAAGNIASSVVSRAHRLSVHGHGPQ